MNHLIVTPTALFFAVALVAVAFFISLKEKIGLEKDLVIGVIRAVIQLTIVGYVLTYIISVNRAWLTLLMVAIIVFNAAWNARGRAKGIPHAFVISLLAIAVAGILGGGMFNAMLAMGITGWTIYARLARAQVLALKKEPYVQAAKLSGCSALRIMTTTLLPNMLGPLIVNAATQIGVMMIGIAGLSFLGIGITEPQAEWGSMINLSRAYVQLAPWAVFAPAGATVLTVMIFNYLADCIRDYLEIGGRNE